MSHFDNQTPYVPTYPPALGSQKLMELEADNSFLKYLYPEEGRLLRDMIEVVLYHEIMYRRNRYRNHKRLYL